jgi:2-polyprenyl-6-methoxyphenol hydroxylase-like FAD-dependent oxidoreductase
VRIACLGGGPGGLLAALLAKRSDPDREVTVFERNRAGDTFGFGVVFSDATLDGIDAADPVLRRALDSRGVHWNPIEVRLHGERWRFGGNGMAAVARRSLLALLTERAAAVGVDIRFATPVDPGDLLRAGYDLVIAADGANSSVRTRFSEEFGPSVVTATAKFIWFGTTYPFGGLTFVHEQSPHGVFAVHGYPIGNGTSTFIVETDEESWRAAGLDAFDVSQPPGPSDELTRAYLEKLFAEQIDGAPLLVNNSRWGNFRTWRTQRWRHRAGPSGGTAVALLGDAAHTAHFSVGSGTKMAMEDAIALVAALDARAPGPSPSAEAVDAALADYEASRRPQVTRIQDAARPSLSWWEHFGRSYRHLPPWQFAFHFFSRSLPAAKLRQRDAAFTDAVLAAWRSAHDGAAPLDAPLDIAGLPQPGRVVPVHDRTAHLASGPLPLLDHPPATLGPPTAATLRPPTAVTPGPPTAATLAALAPSDPPVTHDRWGLWVEAPVTEGGLDATSDTVARGLAAGACLVAVGGGTSLTRRLACEVARLEHGAVTLLVEDGGDDPARAQDAALTAVLSGRADLVGRPLTGSTGIGDTGVGSTGIGRTGEARDGHTDR